MAGRPWMAAETTWAAVRDTAFEVAVLPWGATEPHNLHLPFGTDTVESAAIAAEAGRLAWERGARVAVLPTVRAKPTTGTPAAERSLRTGTFAAHAPHCVCTR